MKRLVLCTLLLFALPGHTKDFDDLGTIFNSVYSDNPNMAASSVTDRMNQLSKQFKTVDSLADRLSDAFANNEIDENSMLTHNLKYALQFAQSKGFGSAKLDRWRWKFVKGICDQQNIVFYTTAIHTSKKLLFGFYLSEGMGSANESEIKLNKLNIECH